MLRNMLGLLTAIVILGAGGSAFAGGSAAAFHPATPGDVPGIYNNGNYLYNQSSSQAAVVADLGTGTGAKSVTVYGWTQGDYSDTYCYLMYDSLTDSVNRGYSNIGYWEQLSAGAAQFTLSVPTPPAGPTYSYTIWCNIAGANSAVDAIFGWN